MNTGLYDWALVVAGLAIFGVIGYLVWRRSQRLKQDLIDENEQLRRHVADKEELHTTSDE